MKLFWLTTLAMVAFAANSVLTRVALAGGSDPFGFAALRVVSGAAVLIALLGLRQGFSRLRPHASIASALALTAYMLGFSLAYLSLPAGVGALVLFGVVQLSMFAGAVLLKEELPVQRWLGGGLALAGLTYLLVPEGHISFDATATLAMVAAGVGWGIYSLIGRGARDPLSDTAHNFAWAVLPTALVWFILQGSLSGSAAILAVIAGGVTSGCGYALWYGILPSLGASRAAVVQLSVPIIAMAGGVIFLGEAVTVKFVISSILVLGGIGVSLMRRPIKA